jgi:hypothetical protein
LQPAAFINWKSSRSVWLTFMPCTVTQGTVFSPSCDQPATEFLGARQLEVPDVVGDADLGGAQAVHQPLPFLHHTLHRARPPGVAGDRLGAEGALVGAAAAGQDREAACVRVQPVGERLQVGVAVDLEEIVRRERQRVQVRDHRAFRAGDDLAVADEVDARNHAGQSARFQRVDQLEEEYSASPLKT